MCVWAIGSTSEALIAEKTFTPGLPVPRFIEPVPLRVPPASEPPPIDPLKRAGEAPHPCPLAVFLGSGAARGGIACQADHATAALPERESIRPSGVWVSPVLSPTWIFRRTAGELSLEDSTWSALNIRRGPSRNSTQLSPHE